MATSPFNHHGEQPLEPNLPPIISVVAPSVPPVIPNPSSAEVIPPGTDPLIPPATLTFLPNKTSPGAIPPLIGEVRSSKVSNIAPPPTEASFSISDSPTVKPPTLISAQDRVWGDNPDTFWKQQAQSCENCTETKTKTELIEFAKHLDGTTKEEIQPWSAPIHIPKDADLWIIGDLHGDLLAFRALTEFAKRTSAKNGRTVAWCFLGDLFDDGQYGHVVLHEVLSLVDGKTGFLVAGNHDLALYWNEDDCRFGGDVTPHDFADWLNGCSADDPWRTVAIAATRWFKNAPRALLLGDGTLIAHGGCVHADRLALLDEPGGLLQPGVLEDLVWLRAHDTSKRKIPNRTGRGCQFGVEDFRDFLKKLNEVLGLPILRVIRGHDHVLERWASPLKYEGRLLTINAMSWRQREAIGPFVRQPVIARHCPNEFPELFQMEIPAVIVERLYGEKGQTKCGTSRS